ncbi:MAG TPA: VWA domain-containing protein [Verrucomicrobiae bacterium]|nr:VWA domain-containing protein [Verrucomicrobiae bacterium]
MRTAFLAISLFCFSLPLFAQTPGEIEIVFDASGSMNDAPRGTTKLDEAKQALTTVAGQISPGSRVGLRVFGVTPVQENIRESCTDSKLLVPISDFDAGRMTTEVQALKSYGMTALGYSLEQAGGDFTQAADVKKTIVLISDGEETCGKDPVAVIQDLKARGIEFTIHAIGFDASDAAKGQLKKLAEMTSGTFVEAKDAGELKKSLEEVAEKTKLLTAQKGGGDNILSAANGTTIVSSSTQDFAYMIDGDEKEYKVLPSGSEAVFAFKQPVLLEKFAVPIFEVSDYNPSDMKLFASLDSPEKGFFPIAEFKVQNKVYFGNIYQEFQIQPPAVLRYLRVQVGKSVGGGNPTNYEWKAYGKYLSEEEFQAEAAKRPKPEINLLAAENGGQFIAGSRDNMKNLIDGHDGAVGESGDFYPNDEAIYGFEGGKTALLTKVAVPILEASNVNCKTIEFSVSEAAPSGPWTSVGKFETTNMVFAGNPYQEYKFEQPVKAKFLKVKLIDTHGGGWCSFKELQASGSLES